MKNLNYYLIGIPCLYSSISLYRSASIADSIIVACLCSLVGLFFYLEKKFPKEVKNESELSRLESELRLERTKMAIDQLKETNLREKALRDARNAITGSVQGKTVKF